MAQYSDEQIKFYSSSISLLIVEDDDLSIMIYQDMLGEYFSSIEIASNGEEAYKKWSNEKNKYDLILTDILMPKMSGIELITKIREESIDQRFIVVSGLNDLNELKDVINLGVDGILEKPLSKDKFFTLAYRVITSIFKAKVLKTQVKQLLLSSKDKVNMVTFVSITCVNA